MLTLTMDGYSRMRSHHAPDGRSYRDHFDDWLRDQKLDTEGIFEGVFGEGVFKVRRYKKDSHGKVFVFHGRVASETVTFELSSPPPSFVYEFCVEG